MEKSEATDAIRVKLREVAQLLAEIDALLTGPRPPEPTSRPVEPVV